MEQIVENAIEWLFNIHLPAINQSINQLKRIPIRRYIVFQDCHAIDAVLKIRPNDSNERRRTNVVTIPSSAPFWTGATTAADCSRP